jgi:transcription elongation factor Elf1
MSDEAKPIGRLRKLYRTIACAMCGYPLEVEVSDNAQDGTILNVFCDDCGEYTKVRLTGDALEGVDYES